MNKAVSQLSVTGQEGSLAHNEGGRHHIAGDNPALLRELIHEVRQPLGVIDVSEAHGTLFPTASLIPETFPLLVLLAVP